MLHGKAYNKCACLIARPLALGIAAFFQTTLYFTLIAACIQNV